MRKQSLSFALLAVMVAVPLWGQRSLLKSLGVVKPSKQEFNNSVQSANLDNVKIGIKAKFDVKERFNGTPYVLSALNFRTGPETAQVIAALLDAGADVNATAIKAEGSEFPDGETALMRASQVECADSVELLLSRGANANARDAGGNNALVYGFHANKRDCYPIVAKLLAAGAEFSPEMGAAILWEGVNRNQAGLVKAILARGLDPNAATRPQIGWTVLMQAARNGNVEIAKLLLDARADPSAKNSDGQTALDVAKDRRMDEAAKLLEGAQAR